MFETHPQPYAVVLFTNYYDEAVGSREYEVAMHIAELSKEFGAKFVVYGAQASPSVLTAGKLPVVSFDAKAKARCAIGQMEGVNLIALEPAFLYQNFVKHTPVAKLGDGTIQFQLPLPGDVKLHMIDGDQIGDAVKAVLDKV